MKRELTMIGIVAALLIPAWAASRVVVIDGFQLSYTVEGKGIPCLVINDAPAMRRGLSQGLRGHFKFIFMDPRMNVAYDPAFDPKRITLDTLLDDIERIRREANEDKVLVFGHSVNGITAYEYARKYKDHVVGVVMNATSPFQTEKLEKEFWSTAASPERKEALRKSQERTRERIAKLPPGEAMRQSYIANAAIYWFNPLYDPSWLLEGVRWNSEVWYPLFDVVMARYDISKRDAIGVPVFVSLGKYDFSTPRMAWDGIDRVLPNLTLHVFEKSGHWSFVEEPELFDKALLDWVARTGLESKR